ncbi:MAG: DUF3472 domain-containing protein [Prevotellaceae bacterium]|jgi:hypothetical protein|nr:DUF3472 domain-containing protein [Prevotellaceae bacterium]
MERLLAFILVVFVSCGSIPKAVNVVSIPLGGNTYITKKMETDSPDSRRRRSSVSDKGIVDWKDSATVYSVYFRTSRTGSLNLFLRYGDADGSTVKVAAEGKEFYVKLGSHESDTTYIGTVAVKDTGYIRVDLQGVTKKGKIYASAYDLLVNGDAAGGKLHFVNDFSFYWGRRGPSVHLNYPFPENETVEWFYNEITAPEGEDPVGTYYMSNGFAEGYFGMQVNSPTERRVLFSVWSPYKTDNPGEIPDDMKIVLLKKGENTRTGEFGNEGSGGQSYMTYTWKTGNTYRFLTRIRPDGKGSSIYTSYFYGDEGKWILVASWLRPKTDTYYKRAHSFLESFNPEKGYLSRKALYCNQWARTIDGKWIELTEARFSTDETGRKQARMDYTGGVESGGFFLQNCGFLNGYTVPGTLFTRAANGKAPEIDFEKLEELTQ